MINIRILSNFTLIFMSENTTRQWVFKGILTLDWLICTSDVEPRCDYGPSKNVEIKNLMTRMEVKPIQSNPE